MGSAQNRYMTSKQVFHKDIWNKKIRAHYFISSERKEKIEKKVFLLN